MFVGTGAIGGLNPTATWRHGSNSSTNQTTFSVGSVPFGVASDRRWIAVAFRCTNLTANLSAPSSCTIGGVSATLLLQRPAGTGAAHRQIWIAKVPTGTDGTISISRAANMTSQVIEVWSLHDIRSGTPDTADAATFGNPTTLDLTIVGRGLVIVFAEGVSSGPYAFTGANEDEDTSLGTLHYAAASRSKVPAGVLSLSVTGGGNHNMIAASFH